MLQGASRVQIPPSPLRGTGEPLVPPWTPSLRAVRLCEGRRRRRRFPRVDCFLQFVRSRRAEPASAVERLAEGGTAIAVGYHAAHGEVAEWLKAAPC